MCTTKASKDRGSEGSLYKRTARDASSFEASTICMNFVGGATAPPLALRSGYVVAETGSSWLTEVAGGTPP